MSLDTLLASWRAGEFDDRALTRLPTFGGSEPESGTSGVWSWDATRLLVGTCASDARIVDRVAFRAARNSEE